MCDIARVQFTEDRRLYSDCAFGIYAWNCIYRRIPKISPGAYIFQMPVLRGLFLERFIYGGKFEFQNRLGSYWEGNLRLKIDWASL